jgi:hypothetical protein
MDLDWLKKEARQQNLWVNSGSGVAQQPGVDGSGWSCHWTFRC